MSWVWRRRTRALIYAAIMLSLLVAGCGIRLWPRRGAEEPITENPFPGIRHIAVAEFRDWSGYSIDGWKVADYFASELSQVGLYDVMPAMQTRAASLSAGLDSRDPKNALAIAKNLKADAVVIGGITTFEPYVPKRVGLSVVILTTGADLSDEGVEVIMELERTGKAMSVFSPSAPEGMLAYGSRVFDAAQNEVVDEAKAYAAGRKGRQGPLGWRAYLEITDEFLRFACNRLIRRMLTEQPSMKGATAGRES